MIPDVRVAPGKSLRCGAGVVATIFVLASFAFAAEPAQNVHVKIRAVRASGLGGPPAQKVGKRLKDIQSKLKSIGYSSYKLASIHEESVELMKRQTVQLVDGHTLTFRPLYLHRKEGKSDRSRIGMWLNWKDQSGMQVLDTRMHFNCGENMLTGTERSADSGIILAISVTPE